MGDATGMPRLDKADTIDELIPELPVMRKILEHHRSKLNPNADPRAERTLMSCVQVQLWVDDDGRESIVVLGDESAAPLELKGLLHDGVYALAHEDEAELAH
jgi:hypothetical protein